MANPLGAGGELADGSIVSFTPDGRFSSVEFDCYRGDDLTSTVTMPFLGWAVVAFQQAGEPGHYYTQLLAVGLGVDGRPATEADLHRVHDLDEGKGIRTRLIAAAAAAESGARSLSRIPIDEIIGSFDAEPDPLFEAAPEYDPEIFPLAPTDSAADALPDDDDPEVSA